MGWHARGLVDGQEILVLVQYLELRLRAPVRNTPPMERHQVPFPQPRGGRVAFYIEERFSCLDFLPAARAGKEGKLTAEECVCADPDAGGVHAQPGGREIRRLPEHPGFPGLSAEGLRG